jgi:hypothetical protein
MTYNPFTAVITPVEPLDTEAATVSVLQRSMMWDLVGVKGIREEPMKYGQNPASQDVIDKEYEEMIVRKSAITALGYQLPLLCHVAVESASQVLMASDPHWEFISPEDKLKFRMHNSKVATAVTESVISHLLQGGLIHIGGHN